MTTARRKFWAVPGRWERSNRTLCRPWPMAGMDIRPRDGAGMMPHAVLELQRARRELERFCHRRNASTGGDVAWRLVRAGNDWFIHGPLGGGGPLLRLRFADDRWLVFVPAGEAWRPYPPLPEATAVTAVIDELEQEPLHVHW